MGCTYLSIILTPPLPFDWSGNQMHPLFSLLYFGGFWKIFGGAHFELYFSILLTNPIFLFVRIQILNSIV
jgi:hypothetical protein